MTKYERVAQEMFRDIDLIVEAIRNNNGKIPSKMLGERYQCDPTALSAVAIGILAWNRPNVRIDTKYGEIAKKMVSDGKIIAQAKYDNNGRTPYKWLGERYNADSSAMGEISIGLFATLREDA